MWLKSLLSSGLALSLVACFPSLPPEEVGADSNDFNRDALTPDSVADADDATGERDTADQDIAVGDSEPEPDDVGSDEVSPGRWMTNLPAEVRTSWGRAGSFVIALSDGAASPTRRFSVLGETCSFDVLVGATDGAVRWTCSAAVERCSATIEARDGARSEAAELDILCINGLPEVSDVMVEPTSAFPGELLTCKYRFDDADGDDDKSTIQWFDGSTVVGEGAGIQAPFQPGRSISCVVTPHDGLESAIAQRADGAIMGFSSISAGAGHTCAIATDGRVWCWGFNNIAQLGNGTTEDSTRPKAVFGSLSARLVDGAASGACAVKPDEDIVCWGLKPEGWLLGPELTELDPGLIATRPATIGVTDVSSVGHGGLFACALNALTKVWCWGYNGDGALGLGTNAGSAAPVEVPNLNAVTLLDAGDVHACAVAGGSVYCWGGNDRGQLGVGDYQNRNSRTLVSGPTGVTALAVGSESSCARNANGWACWGNNGFGQLGLAGDAANEPRVFSPSHSVELAPLDVIALGRSHVCGLTTTGEAKCVGAGTGGRLGNGANQNSTTLQAVAGLPTAASQLSVGAEHACVIAGAWPYCWGENGFGQLGTGDRFDKSTATPVVTPVR